MHRIDAPVSSRFAWNAFRRFIGGATAVVHRETIDVETSAAMLTGKHRVGLRCTPSDFVAQLAIDCAS
jgi:hypothetical protein